MARGRPTVHLVDAFVYVFRAYHSLPPMETPDGTPAHAAYGFTNSLLRFLREVRPTHVGMVFDHSMESFRNELEPGYKEGRTEAPEDLEPQLELCLRVVEALGLALFDVPDYEADDVLATLATRLASRGARVRVLSGDKDLAQLVRKDGTIVVGDLAKDDATLDYEGVREKFGVPPDLIPDWLGLVGDAVDNLPGVPGVGPRTAAPALLAFGRIEEIPADPEAWQGVPVRGAARAARAIAAHRERALRTRELATLRRDVPHVRADLRHLRWRGADPARVERCFAELGWGRIATRVPYRTERRSRTDRRSHHRA